MITFQEIVVILIGIGCLIWMGMRIYRTFKGVRRENSPCANCPTGCELYRQLQEKQRSCGKSEQKRKKSCCG